MAMQTRAFGKTGAQVSILGLGGHHLGDLPSMAAAKELVHAAIDGGVTFFDNCWEYWNGRTEEWLGHALVGKRDKVFLMTKVCTHGRDGALATKMLEESLRRLKTDHLDLWQVHGMSFENDPELAFRKGGVVEALEAARKAGKVRFLGFTGHKNPDVHMGMLSRGFSWDAAQFPLNAFDASFRSFERTVLPECVKQKVAVIGMKPMCGTAQAVKKGDVTAEEMLRYAMSLPGVSVTISGCDSLDVLKQNLKVAQSFQPMSDQERQALRDRVRPKAKDGRYEMYKLSMKFDNPEARLAHGFPVDDKQKEVQEALDLEKTP